MTKLQKVREALAANPDVVVAGERVKFNLYAPDWNHSVKIFVGMAVTLYDASDLQVFLNGLNLGVEPTARDRFYADPAALSIGALYFDEVIGTANVSKLFVTDDPFLKGLDHLKTGEHTESNSRMLMRRTWVHVYPSATIARDVHSSMLKSLTRITWSEIERYRTG